MHFSEDDLRSALRRKSPSEDFAERVLMKASQMSQTKIAQTKTLPAIISPNWLQHGWMRWAASAMAACLLLAGLVEYRHYIQERDDARAAEKAALAFRITDEKLNLVIQRSILERGVLPHLLEISFKPQKEHL